VHEHRLVDQEAHPDARELSGDHRGRLQIVVAPTREHSALECGQRCESGGQTAGRALRLHRQVVAGEQHQVWIGSHGSLGDAAQTLDGHERAEVWVGDLHDAKRSLAAGAAMMMPREAVDRLAVEHEVDAAITVAQALAETD
jgi:hypothetical protein